jgi:hypothetical protein
VTGAAAHQQADWLPADVGPAWLVELAQRHRAAALAFAEAVNAHGQLLDGATEGQRAHRRAVREAVANGQTPPAPPDPAVWAAQVEIAAEDAAETQQDVDAAAVDALGLMRAKRKELAQVLPEFSTALLAALVVGGGPGCDLIAREQRIREVRDLGRVRGFSENVDGDPQAATTDEAEHTAGAVVAHG